MFQSRRQSAGCSWHAPPSGALAGFRLRAPPGSSVSFRETPAGSPKFYMPSLWEVTRGNIRWSTIRRNIFLSSIFLFDPWFCCAASSTERANTACCFRFFFRVWHYKALSGFKVGLLCSHVLQLRAHLDFVNTRATSPERLHLYEAAEKAAWY